MLEDKKVVKIGKFLSFVLRHHPEAINLKLDDAGWTDIKELIKKAQPKGYQLNFDIIKEVVEKDNKNRFKISDDGTKIRANQGHSLNIDLGLKEQIPPDILYHGTAERFIESIYKNGIVKGSRHHVHLSTDKSTAASVGQRYGKPIVLTVNSKKMYEEGKKFYRSENFVWLTEYVAPKYIQWLELLKSEQSL